MPSTCPFWGSGAYWGDGSLYCSTASSVLAYSISLDSLRTFINQWNLVDSSGVVWTPTISTSGVITLTSSSGTTSTQPIIPISDGSGVRSMSVSTLGVITTTIGTDTGQSAAVLTDSGAQDWSLLADSSAQILVNPYLTNSPRLHLLQMRVKHSAGGDFRIYQLRPIGGMDNYFQFDYVTQVDDTRYFRLALSIKHGDAGNFVFWYARPEVRLLEQEPVG